MTKAKFRRGFLLAGTEIKRLRALLGLSQSQLAAKLSLHTNSVARMERNEIPIREGLLNYLRELAK